MVAWSRVESRGVAWSREIQNCNLLYSSIETPRQLIFKKFPPWLQHVADALYSHGTVLSAITRVMEYFDVILYYNFS